jgi:hypothetical protein
MFGCPINSDYEYFHRRSVMTAVEAAVYFAVPNIIMVQVYPPAGHQERKPWEPPLEQYVLPLKPFKRVEWSVVGAGGTTKGWETHQVLDMAFRTSNFVGVYMDDFFENGKASFTLDEIRALRQRLVRPAKTLDLNVTLYTYQLHLPIGEYLDLMDQITLWTWKPADLANLDTNLTMLERLAPKARKMLGCYVVDYDEGASVPIPAMQQQCELGLRWLRDGRIEGIVFLGNTVMDLGFEAVDWTRDWIQKLGDKKL